MTLSNRQALSACTAAELRAFLDADAEEAERLREREEILDALVSLLSEAEFSAADLRFLFVITTMAIAVKPAMFFERLRTAGASDPTSEQR